MKKFLLFIFGTIFSISLVSQTSVGILSQTNVTCPGMCNGAITLSITGGTMPYTVSNLGSSTCTFPPYPPVFSSTITISGLCACAYNIQVKDVGNNLIGTVPATITAPPPIAISFSIQNICCNGQCNGNIITFVTGGTPPYMYTWAPFSPPNLCAGNYTLSVIDSNGCSKTLTTQVTQPAPFVVTTSVALTSCSSCCNGSVYAFGSGGNPGYTYTINPGATTNTTGAFTNLCAGVYQVCANDAGCCSYCTNVIVPSGSSTSVQYISNQFLNVYVVPNPSDGNFKLSSHQNLSLFNYELFDIIGNKLISGQASDQINISQSAEGVYILILKNAGGEIVAKRKINITH